MLSFLFIIIVIFIVLKILISKNAKHLLKVNPYIQIFIAFPISFVMVLILPSSYLIGLYIYVVTMYLGLVFQEYYQKFSFKGE